MTPPPICLMYSFAFSHINESLLLNFIGGNCCAAFQDMFHTAFKGLGALSSFAYFHPRISSPHIKVNPFGQCIWNRREALHLQSLCHFPFRITRNIVHRHRRNMRSASRAEPTWVKCWCSFCPGSKRLILYFEKSVTRSSNYSPAMEEQKGDCVLSLSKL